MACNLIIIIFFKDVTTVAKNKTNDVKAVAKAPPGCTFLYFIFGASKLGRVARILDCAGLLTVVSLSLYLLDYVGLIAWSSP